MGSTGVQKDINELKRLVQPQGFKYVPNGSGHLKLVNKKGAVVVDADGPVIMSTSASDFRARDMHVKRLLGVGALKSDPWSNKTKAKTEEEREEGRGRGKFNEETRQKSRETQARLSRERAAKTMSLRGRVEPFVVAIGGWDKRGVASEFSTAAFHFLHVRGRVECWKTQSGAEQNLRQLKLGNTLSDQGLGAWNLFMDEIERAGSTINDRRERYFHLVREAKGTATATHAPEPGAAVAAVVPAPEPTPEPVKQNDDVEALAKYRNNGYRTPELALRALSHMKMDTPEEREEAVKIAKDILDQEITAITRGYSGVQVDA